MVIFDFAKNRSPEQRKANATYGGEMFALFAEVGAGPMHFGKAVTLEGAADFDQVIIVFYPGVEFFGEMIVSQFYQGIFSGKQLGDDISSLTVTKNDAAKRDGSPGRKGGMGRNGILTPGESRSLSGSL